MNKIQRHCTEIGDSLLIHIRKKRVYKLDEFQQRQETHRQKMREVLETTHKEIQRLMKATFEVFRYDSVEVHQEWFLFAEMVDKMVEAALRQTVKRSLQELSRSVNGDGKSEIYPLFHLNVTLDVAKVELKPSLEELIQMVSTGSKVRVCVVYVVLMYRI